MFNMDKITRTKIAMLVTVVLLTIFATIALYYTMTVSAVTTLGAGDPVLLNLAMVFAIVIAFMWVIALILFYEFKTDDAIKTHVHALEKKVVELDEFKTMLKETVYTPATINPDVLKDGGIQGHVPQK